MTESYYQAKRQEYMASNAAPEVKEAAIKALDAKHLVSLSVLIAEKDIEDAQPELAPPE